MCIAELMAIDRFEKLFREAAGLDVDKSDLRRLDDFVKQKVHDLLVAGQVSAKANGRDVIQPQDLPVTKGLQESVHEFKRLDIELELKPILDQLTTLPRLDLDYGEETEARLPGLVGALTISLAKTFKVLDPALKNPQTSHWDRAEEIFSMLL